MKKSFLYTCLFVLMTTFSFAQKPIDTDSTDSLATQGSSASGFDITALIIGLVVGLVIGYVVGSRMGKKP